MFSMFSQMLWNRLMFESYTVAEEETRQHYTLKNPVNCHKNEVYKCCLGRQLTGLNRLNNWSTMSASSPVSCNMWPTLIADSFCFKTVYQMFYSLLHRMEVNGLFLVVSPWLGFQEQQNITHDACLLNNTWTPALENTVVWVVWREEEVGTEMIQTGRSDRMPEPDCCWLAVSGLIGYYFKGSSQWKLMWYLAAFTWQFRGFHTPWHFSL